MKLSPQVQEILEAVALTGYLLFAALFTLLQLYSVVPTGVFASVPYLIWAAGLAVLALLKLAELLLVPSRSLRIFVPVAGLWVWAVLFTSAMGTPGVNLLAIAYTLAILLDAAILASNFPAKR